MPTKVSEKRDCMNEFKVWVITDVLSVGTRVSLYMNSISLSDKYHCFYSAPTPTLSRGKGGSKKS